jgi:hypothetical protein
MTTSDGRRRGILREGRGLQRYACGAAAPRFALRRYARLLGADARPLRVPAAFWRMPWLVWMLEPVPLLPRSAAAREFARRLFLVVLVTELTPWGSRRSRAAAERSFAGALARVLAFGVLEAASLPARLAVHGLAWWPRGAAS